VEYALLCIFCCDSIVKRLPAVSKTNFCFHQVQPSLNVMAHAHHKPDFVFRRNGRVHLNRPVGGRQFSRLLAAEVCASAVVMLEYTMFRGSVKSTVYPTPFAGFLPFTSPPVGHRVPSHFNWSLLHMFLLSEQVSTLPDRHLTLLRVKRS